MAVNPNFNKILSEALEKNKPTNADKIRAMSDVELSELFGQSCDCDNACCFVYDKDVSCMNGCASAWLDWLKQEVEQDEP